MNIQQVKAEIAAKAGIQLPNLQLVRQFDSNEDGTINEQAPQPWLSHWDNDNRVRVTVHEDILAELRADPNFSGLAVRKDMVEANATRAGYIRFVLITPKHIEATF